MVAINTCDNSPLLPDALARPILERAFIDCVFLFWKYAEGFTSKGSPSKNATINTKMNIISEEYSNMLAWLNSDQFVNICSFLQIDECHTRTQLLNTLHNPKEASRIAHIFDIRIHSAKLIPPLVILFFLSLPLHAIASPPFPLVVQTATHLSQTSDNTSPITYSLTALVNKTDNYFPIITKGNKPKTYKHVVYTYLTSTGEKIDLPFAVKGVKNALPEAQKHPIMARLKLYGRKVVIFQPFLNAAGAIAQIFTAFKL